MKTWQILASTVVGVSLIASATVPRPARRVTASAQASVIVPPRETPARLETLVVTVSDTVVVTTALLAEQRRALVAEARAQTRATRMAPPTAVAP